jgi:hypothetical protein
LLQAGRSRDQIPLRARFFAPGPGAHPISFVTGTVSLLAVMGSERCFNYPDPYISIVKERKNLYVCSSLRAFVASSGVKFILIFDCILIVHTQRDGKYHKILLFVELI